MTYGCFLSPDSILTSLASFIPAALVVAVVSLAHVFHTEFEEVKSMEKVRRNGKHAVKSRKASKPQIKFDSRATCRSVVC